jgi:hypothetical protein
MHCINEASKAGRSHHCVRRCDITSNGIEICALVLILAVISQNCTNIEREESLYLED